MSRVIDTSNQSPRDRPVFLASGLGDTSLASGIAGCERRPCSVTRKEPISCPHLFLTHCGIHRRRIRRHVTG
ncbi:hypothetical protein CBS147345_779 [Aspergillus niger]|nr:hypothetical protein CBS147345_779 [Aspergillus niger]